MIIMSIQDIEKRYTVFKDLMDNAKNNNDMEAYERFSILYKSYKDMRSDYYKENNKGEK
jgi:hypothetical protein